MFICSIEDAERDIKSFIYKYWVYERNNNIICKAKLFYLLESSGKITTLILGTLWFKTIVEILINIFLCSNPIQFKLSINNECYTKPTNPLYVRQSWWN